MSDSSQSTSIDTSYKSIIHLALPLILSMSGLMIMQFVDALFLSWYSPESIAAAVPAGMAGYLIISIFQGTAGYTSTFVAHHTGANTAYEAASMVWQGIYTSLIAGVIVALFALLGTPLFTLVGHEKSVAVLESRYFAITCLGGVFTLLASALSGFFTGRGKTGLIMTVQIAGFALNAVLAWTFIFGKAGRFLEGVTGAAVATVIAQIFVVMLLAIAFFSSRNRREFQTAKAWHFSKPLFLRLVKFGFPAGIRFGAEMLAWTLFLFFAGRVGTLELAASNIAFRINGIAFFPIVGVAQAVAILVGQAQGAKDPACAAKITRRGLLLSEAWMIAAALFFICFPGQLYGLFEQDMSGASVQASAIIHMGTLLLRMVALYCLLDACNIVVISALQAAGDTRWTMWASLIMHGIFLTVLFSIDHIHGGLFMIWGTATCFVMTMAILWVARFKKGIWRKIVVLDSPVQEVHFQMPEK